MFKKKRILAIIPARSGSKRIKNKNLKLINGKPLIYYTIKYAIKNNSYIDDIFVSTDSRKISNFANKIKKDLSPILRPKKISDDKSSDLGFVFHALKYFQEMKNLEFDIVAILRPTTPIRDKNLFKECLKNLLKLKASSIRSSKEVKHNHPYWMYSIKKNKLVEVIRNKNFFKYYQSQKLPKFFMHDGHCDIFLKKNLYKKDNKTDLSKLYGKKMIYFENKNNLSINIDEENEFLIAEYFLKKFNK